MLRNRGRYTLTPVDNVNVSNTILFLNYTKLHGIIVIVIHSALDVLSIYFRFESRMMVVCTDPSSLEVRLQYQLLHNYHCSR